MKKEDLSKHLNNFKSKVERLDTVQFQKLLDSHKDSELTKLLENMWLPEDEKEKPFVVSGVGFVDDVFIYDAASGEPIFHIDKRKVAKLYLDELNDKIPLDLHKGTFDRAEGLPVYIKVLESKRTEIKQEEKENE